MLVNPFASNSAPFFIVFFVIFGISIGLAGALRKNKRLQIIFIVISMIVMIWYVFFQKILV